MHYSNELPFFTRDELACQGTGIIKMDIHLAVHLPLLRLEWGKPLSPSSVCRTPKHNARVGGHPHSMHLTDNPKWPTDGTAAADIKWRHWPKDEKLRFAQLAWKRGWSVGLHDGFCHIDRRIDFGLQQAVFLYGTWSGAFDPDEVMG